MPLFTAEDKIVEIHNDEFQCNHLLKIFINDTVYSGAEKI